MSKALEQLKAVAKEQKLERKAEKLVAKTATISATATKEDKFKMLEAVAKTLNTQFKTTNSIQRMGERAKEPVPHTATTITSLDKKVFGVGGVPDGRIIEVYGPESAGKTTITLELIAAHQRIGNLAAFVDAEHSLDPNYASKIGVNMDELLISQPDSGEQALETVIALIESRTVNIIAVDSVAALTPQAELDGEMGDANMGLQARLISQAMRKIRGIANLNGVSIIFINQLRDKLGVMFGNPETTTGGKALRYYSSVRLDVRRVSKTDGGEIKVGETQIGHRMRVKAVKNKVASPFGETVLDLIYGEGIDRDSDLIGYAVEVGVVEKAGAWFSFEGVQLGQGLINTVDNIKSDVVLFEKIKTALNNISH